LTNADSNKIPVRAECTAGGVRLIANLTRFGKIDPSLRSNTKWEPIAEAAVSGIQRDATVEVEWIMHSTDDSSVREWIDKKTITIVQPSDAIHDR
jgi:hypothetical protein